MAASATITVRVRGLWLLVALSWLLERAPLPRTRWALGLAVWLANVALARVVCEQQSGDGWRRLGGARQRFRLEDYPEPIDERTLYGRPDDPAPANDWQVLR